MNVLEREMRSLLRHRGDERTLTRITLGRTLQRAVGSATIRRALAQLVEEAFGTGASDESVALLRRVLDGDRSGLSERLYYRRRSQAIRRLCTAALARMHAVASTPGNRQPAPTPIALPMVDRLAPERIDPMQYRGVDRSRALSAAALAAEMGGDIPQADRLLAQAYEHVYDHRGFRDPRALFEVAQNALYIARCRGDLSGMNAAIDQMKQLWERIEPSARMKVGLDCSELHLYQGETATAHAELEYALAVAGQGEGLLHAIALVRQAQLALLASNYARAQLLATRALELGAPHADVRAYACEVIGRCAWRTGRRWSSGGLEDCSSAFHALSVQTIATRDALLKGDDDLAWERARTCYAQALALRYWNLASRAAATLAGCRAGGAEVREGAWLTESLRLFFKPQRVNVYVGLDLFAFPNSPERRFAPSLRDAAVHQALREIYAERFSDSICAADPALLEGVLRAVIETLRTNAHPPLRDLRRRAAAHWGDRVLLQRRVTQEAKRLGWFVGVVWALAPATAQRAPAVQARAAARSVLHELQQAAAYKRLQSHYIA